MYGDPFGLSEWQLEGKEEKEKLKNIIKEVIAELKAEEEKNKEWTLKKAQNDYMKNLLRANKSKNCGNCKFGNFKLFSATMKCDVTGEIIYLYETDCKYFTYK